MSTINEHVWFKEQLATYLAGGLAGDELARFETHAAACEGCANELQRARHDEDQLGALFDDAAPAAGFEDRIIARLRTATTRRFRIHPLLMRAAATAAAVVIVGGVGFVATESLKSSAAKRGATNLRSIGQAILMDSNDAKPLEARTIVTSAPSANAEKWDFGGGSNTALDWSNRNGLAGVQRNLGDRRANPYPASPGTSDSNNHDEDGQNVLYGKGHVEYASNPFVDIQRDNIYKTPESQPGQQTFKDVLTSVSREGAVANQFKPAEFGQAIKEAQLRVSLEEEQLDAKGKLKDAVPPEAAGQQRQQSQAAAGPVTPTTTGITVERKIIRNGEVSFEVDSFDSAVTTISKVVAEESGFIATTNSQKLDNGKVKGTIVVRVLPERLDTLVMKLRALGDLKRQNLSAQDVTKQYTDLESALRAARAMEDRLIDIIKSGKGEIKDLLAAEKELANWRGKIEKIQGEINYYNNLVSLSTLSIELIERNISTAAATIEKEEINAGVETEDVESVRAEAIKSIGEAKGRIIESELKKLDGGQFAAKIVAEVASEDAGAITDRLKQLGKVARLDVQRRQTTPSGTAPAPGARVEQNPTRLIISLYNLANVAPRETTNLNLASTDVEATYRQILARVEKAGGRVISSGLNRERAHQISGTIHFETRSSESGGLLLDVRALGEVLRLAVTENPDTANVTTAKHGFVVQLFSSAQIAPRETIILQVAAIDVANAYQTLVEAARADGRVIASQVNEQDRRNVTGSLDLELPREQRESFEKILAAAGDVLARNATRSSDAENTLDSKLRVQIALIGADRVPPRESTQIGLQAQNVDVVVTKIQSATSSAGGRVVESNLSRDADGRSTARLVLDVPLAQSRTVIDQVKSLGDVRVEQSSKNAQVPEGSLARARVEVAVASPQGIVAGDRGIWSSIREGLSTSAAGLMWSLQILVVGLCFVLPWALILWGGWKVYRRSRRVAV